MWPDWTAEQETLKRPTLRDAAPFVALGALGVVVAELPPYEGSGVEAWLMVLAFLVFAALLALALRQPRRTWLDLAAPLSFFVVIALARDLTGGTSSGLGALVVLPVLWLAITGTALDLALAGLATLATYAVPMALVGAPKYPAASWRPALLWVLFAFVIAPVVQGIVHQLARERRWALQAGADTQAILTGARLTILIATDVEGTIRSFSAGAEELLGYRAADVVGKATPELFHDPDEMAQVAEELGVERDSVLAELARTGASSRVWTYIRADRRPIFVRLALTELRNEHGTVTGILAVGLDTTAAVVAQRALAVSEAQWRVLMQNLPDTTVVMYDEDLRLRLVAGAGAMARSMEGQWGRPLDRVTPPAIVGTVDALVRRALAGERATGEATTEAGEHELIAIPLPLVEGEQLVMLVARDVSDARARERALLSANERTERLFSDAPQGVVVVDRDGRILRANKALRATLGAAPGDLEGKAFASLAPAGDRRLEEHLVEVHEAHGRIVDADAVLVDVRGDEAYVALRSLVLRAPGESGEEEDLVLVNVVDVSDRRRYEQRLAHLADHDVLTGLANRRRFDAELQRHVEYCRRYGPKGAVLLLDLDRFKQVNDTLGHAAGDQLIISAAALLRRGLRGTDVVARLGGDEFAILLTEGDLEAAVKVADDIVERIREYTATLDGVRRRVTASVGVVTMAAAAQHAEDVLALADMTMYDAKDAGRNRYAVLAEGDRRPPRTGARLQWQSRIERALEEDGFELLLQPILDLRTDTIASAEALLRMRDGDELIPPSRFLYIAERAGLMTELDTWVVRHGVGLLAEIAAERPGFQLEVNLSGQSIGRPEVEAAIVGALQDHGVDPAALILEITETAAVADVGLAREFAERMTALGCRFALDDFGAGFGSFYYLKHLLFDLVKIDGEFVANAPRSRVDQTILRSIVGIARDLGKETVAEFVSDAEVLAVVREEGVDLAQGYLIGQPVSLEEFRALYLAG